MEITRRKVREATIEQFADEHGLIMEVNERENQSLPRYYAKLADRHGCVIEIVDGGFLIGAHGNGDTENEAITEYGKRISLKTVRIGKEDVQVPRIIQKNKR